MIENVTPVSYVAVSILFILALAGLASQKKAKWGNFLGMIGMAIALGATLADRAEFSGDVMFWLCVIPGASFGLLVAHKVAMVSMPQLVAALHSFVGLAAVLVGVANLLHQGQLTEWNNMVIIESLETFIGVFIGAITFTGSVVACGKLEGKIRSNPLIIWGWGRHVINAVSVGVCCLFCFIYVAYWNNETMRLALLLTETLIAFFVGWHLVMAIGGADMPVVVSMLNSYSGWATAASGFMLNNDAMIVTGALVGSSGAILSYIMCAAMNRGFVSVIMGGFGGEVSVVAAKDDGVSREYKEFNAVQTAEALLAAQDIVFIPGYGLAVARGQHAVAEIVTILRGMGKNVRFAIHPVAGRLPGHMNVLLAEANVPYNIVLSMEEINDDMPKTDVCVVVGANDIVNPIALTDPTCPIAGMPIIECFKSKLTLVNKRSMASGYAGIDNPLFYYENTRMFFGDAKKAFDSLLEELRKHKVEAEKPKKGSDENTPLMAGQEEKIDLSQLPASVRILGVPKEVTPLERMVALTPQTALQLRKKGFGIVIESGAGAAAAFPDELFISHGCRIVDSASAVYEIADVLLKVQPPTPDEMGMLRHGQTLISFFYPGRNADNLKAMHAKGVTVVAMDMVPRTSKAQKLDALSSLSNLAGYRAVIEASHSFGRLFTGQITAAGKMPPAVVFVIGAGVAGLAAIGTAKSLGAVVKAFDIRKSVKEQIESMGGEFLPVDIDEDAEGAGGYAKGPSPAFIKAEMELFARTCPGVDVIITTAAIPGKKAPIMITKPMVESMRPGSVIVDLAAGTGGNCELTVPGKTIVYNNVVIIGDTDLVSRMAAQASSLYSQNLRELLAMMGGDAAKFNVDIRDDSIRQMTACKDGEMLFPPPPVQVSAAGPKKPAPPVTKHEEKVEEGYTWVTAAVLASLGLLLSLMIFFVPYGFITHFMDFVLAIIVGYHVIWSVTPALHTPLMSETNAISGIIVVGGMLELAPFSQLSVSVVLGAIATSIATINIAGGFYVTYRMLQMFH
ncbi:pyridine nucleotide transhydrogenase [Pelomyxa schiedti]|nr:pyridine nucleotide transhydrogenase [Pelomyxa schiedti]